MPFNTGSTARFLSAISTIAITLLPSLFFLNTVGAQFSSGFPGQMNLPQGDFTWTWGQKPSGEVKFEDFSVFGNERTFRCDLTGKLRVGTRMSRMDIRNLESELRGQMSFIQSATYMMNNLEARRELEWATLECKIPEPSDERKGMSGVRIRPR